VTEWDIYRRELTPAHASSLTGGRLVVDGRNSYDSSEWRAAGWRYIGMGRP
jgi:UDPglucose 6-dehydrogenase